MSSLKSYETSQSTMSDQVTEEHGNGGVAALVQGLVAVIAAVIAGALAPNFCAAHWQSEFRDFFVAAATVNGALLVAISIEARYGRGLKYVAAVTAACLTFGLVCSVLALCPLPKPLYGWLLALTVGGAIGGLFAAILVGWHNLQRDIGDDRADATAQLMAEQLGGGRMELQITMPDGGQGVIRIAPKEDPA